MAHYDMSQGQLITTDWFPRTTDGQLRAIKPRELKAIYCYIGQFFDAQIADRTAKVCVPFNCPDPWPSVLAPIWIAAGRNEEAAAMLLGNLYCRHAITRPELWASSPLALLKWKPRHYIVWLNAPTKLPRIPRALK